MVTDTQLPTISWEENGTPEDEDRVADLIVTTLTGALVAPAQGQQRLFFVVPTPTPYAIAEAELLAAVAPAVKDLRVVTLPRGGRCYATSGESPFRALLPHAFRLGPPELTFIVANCGFDLTAPEIKIAGFVLEALINEPSGVPGNLAGMHFDSGDLVQLF